MLDRIYLHVGPPKTGSTALQDALFKSADLLRAANVYVPLQNNMTCVLQPVRQGKVQVDDAQEYESLLDVINNGGQSQRWRQTFTKIVLSCEFLSGLNTDALQKLNAVLQGDRHPVYPIMYLRDPVSLHKSRVQELLKKGIPYRQTASKIGHRNKALFERLSKVFPDTVIVRKFKSRTSNWSVLEDFENVCELPKLEEPTEQNTSMSLQAAIILDELSADDIHPAKMRDIVKQVLNIPGDPFTLGREEFECCRDDLTQDAEWANRTFHTSFDVQSAPNISWDEERYRTLMRSDLDALLNKIRASCEEEDAGSLFR